MIAIQNTPWFSFHLCLTREHRAYTSGLFHLRQQGGVGFLCTCCLQVLAYGSLLLGRSQPGHIYVYTWSVAKSYWGGVAGGSVLFFSETSLWEKMLQSVLTTKHFALDCTPDVVANLPAHTESSVIVFSSHKTNVASVPSCCLRFM